MVHSMLNVEDQGGCPGRCSGWKEQPRDGRQERQGLDGVGTVMGQVAEGLCGHAHVMEDLAKALDLLHA